MAILKNANFTFLTNVVSISAFIFSIVLPTALPLCVVWHQMYHSFLEIIVYPAEYITQNHVYECHKFDNIPVKSEISIFIFVYACFFSLTGQYFAASIVLVSLSCFFTVIVLNVHHRGATGHKVPHTLQRVLNVLGRLVLVPPLKNGEIVNKRAKVSE